MLLPFDKCAFYWGLSTPVLISNITTNEQVFAHAAVSSTEVQSLSATPLAAQQ